MKFKEFKLWFNDLGIMLKPYWKYGKLYSIIYIVWDAIIGTMSAMLEVLLLETSINQLTAGEGFIKVIITLVIFFAVQIGLGMLGDGMAYFYFNIKQAEISAKIDIEVYNQIRKVDYKYFDTPEFYDSYTLSYGQYAAKSAQTFLQFSAAISLITTISTLVAYILSSTIYVLIVTLVTVVIKVLIEKKGNKLSLEFNEESTPVYRMKSYIQGTLYNRDTAMDSKCTNIFHILITKYKDLVNQDISIQKKFKLKEFFYGFLESVSQYGSSFVIRTIVCSLILIGKVGVGSFVAILNAANTLSWKVQGIAKYYTNLDSSRLYGKKIREFLSLPSVIENCPDAATEESCTNESVKPYDIELRNVSFTYENSGFGLKNINMKISEGKKIAIVGENGGGKTTLTKLLLRLYDPDSGSILIDGKPLTKIALRHYRNNVGIAFQEFPLYSLPLRDNLSVYEPANDKEMNIIFKSLSLDKVLEKNNATFDTDLTRNFDENGIMLSGGEKQKLAVARLMTKKFGLLIFDEPTAALDPIAEAELNKMILDKANTSTTILISHRLSNVVNADYIYVVRNGEIEECGTHEALMAEKGFYYKMFELQAENYK